MNIKDIIEGYRHFKENSAVTDESRSLIDDYQVMINWLNKFCELNELRDCLCHACDWLTIQCVLSRNLKFKDISKGLWSTSGVQDCYHLIKEYNRVFSYGPEAWAPIFKQLCDHVNHLSNKPACYLYCWHCAINNMDGIEKLFLSYYNQANKLLLCKTDEELMKVLNEKQELDKETREVQCPKRQPTDRLSANALFSGYLNASTPDELNDSIIRVQQDYNSGRLCKDDYIIALSYLNCKGELMSVYEKNPPDAKVESSMGIEVLDGDKLMQSL